MGESYPACALTHEPIFDECMFIVLGPAGYGPHGQPPALRPGPKHAFSRESVRYAPLTLPIRGTVTQTWGAMSECLDKEHDEFLKQHWGASAVQIVNSVVEYGGKVVGDRFKAAVDAIDRASASLFDRVVDKTPEQVTAEALENWNTKKAQGKLTDYQLSLGVEHYVSSAMARHTNAVELRDASRRNVYGARWADVMHVSLGAWDQAVSVFLEQYPRNNGSLTSTMAPTLVELAEYSAPIYSSAPTTTHWRDLKVGLTAVGHVLNSMRGYKPTVLYNFDPHLDKIRRAMGEYALKAQQTRWDKWK